MLSLLILVAAGAACPATPASELLTLSYDAFDTAVSRPAWRSLLNQGCVDTAVATLAAYLKANAELMTDAQVTELHFHMGQALTMSGRNAESIPHFQHAISPRSTDEWSAYVRAHLGYAREDRAQVEQALAAYEKVAKSGSMRLSIIRGLLKCIGRPYMEAAHCAM